VVVIVSIMAALVVPYASGSHHALECRDAAQTLAKRIQLAEQLSIHFGQAVALEFNEAQNSYRLRLVSRDAVSQGSTKLPLQAVVWQEMSPNVFVEEMDGAIDQRLDLPHVLFNFASPLRKGHLVVADTRNHRVRIEWSWIPGQVSIGKLQTENGK